jgi:O-antigen/teichoic acid export membrane protein
VRNYPKSGDVTAASIANNVVVNFTGQLIPLLAAVICIPYILSKLGVDRFGVLNLAWVIVGYFSILDFGLGRALTHLLASKSTPSLQTGLPDLAWLSIYMIAGLGMVAALLAIVASPWLVDNIFVIPDVIRLETLTSFYILALSIPLVMVSSGLRGMLEGVHQFRIINRVRIPFGVFSYVSPLLVLPFSQGLLYPVTLIVFGRLLNLLVFLYFCNQFLPWRNAGFRSWSLHRLGYLLRFGGWTTVSNTLGPLMVYMDRFFVGSILSASAVAYYATPYEIVTKLWIFPAALTGVLFPSFTYLNNDRIRSARLLLTSTRLVILITFPLIFVLMMFSEEILMLWLGEDFAAKSADVLMLLAFGVFLNCIAQIPFTYLQGAGRPDVSAKLHMVELVIYIPAVFYLTKTLGIEGTAIAWVGRVGVDLVFILWAVRSLFNINTLDGRLFALLCSLFILTCLVILPISSAYRVVLVAFILASFFTLYWNVVLDLTERQLLLDLMHFKSILR